MPQILRIFISLIIFSTAASAQVSMNLAMHNLLESDQNLNKEMFLLVKGDPSAVREFLVSKGGTFIHSAGDISSVRISLGLIAELVNEPFVKALGSDIHNYRPMNDTMRMLAHVNEVHSGQAPLAQSYKGRGVLMGIIDSGIDLTHPDFQDSTGKTRVLWLWDMNLTSGPNSPVPYNYGQQFSKQQIDSGLATAHTGTDQYGHGTYVAGIAAGNGRAVGHFEGVATESDLIIVGYNFTAQDTISRLAHAVAYIFDKAQQLGRPVVINASLGDYYGSHDGLDLESQYISYMIDQQPGRVVVASAGNIGANYPYHVGRTSVAGDTVFTWNKYNASYAGVYFQVFADTAEFRNVKFSIGADKVNPYYHFRGQTTFTTVFPSINNVINQNLMSGANRLGRIQTYTTINGGVYSIEVYIMPDSVDYYWRFTTTGDGRYDSWAFDWNIANLPTSATYPDMDHYFAPDTLSSLVSGIACLDNVITVANYNNTDRHVDVDSVLQITLTDYPGQLGPNSGRGPTRDGRIKPDVAGPGNHILSAGVQSLIPGLTHNKIALGGMHITGGGTSASAPVVAGVAALLLEQIPAATSQQVKSAITNCAFQDSLMWGPYPNNAWGFGKVDAFESLTTCALNIGVPELTDGQLKLFPNPANDLINVEVMNSVVSKLKIYDITGRLALNLKFNAKTTIDLSGFNEGIYILRVETAEGKTISRKFAVSK